jgi:UDP-3-O-[3-hydroxymyristoyl] glucosamine N-acyltransferase
VAATLPELDPLRGLDPGAHVSPDAVIGESVQVRAGAVIHEGSVLRDGVTIDSCSVVHAGVTVGAGSTVEECVVLGKRPRLRPGSSAGGRDPGELELGEGVTVCCGAVVYAGARIGDRAIVGDQVQIRERAVVGEHTVVGRGSCVDFDARVGSRVLIQTGVYVTGAAIVEDDVFIGPGAIMTNDSTMGRHPRGELLNAPVLRRACRVGGGVVLVPGVEIGEEAFVAAGAVVTRDVAPRALVMGVPARVVRTVQDGELLEIWRPPVASAD